MTVRLWSSLSSDRAAKRIRLRRNRLGWRFRCFQIGQPRALCLHIAVVGRRNLIAVSSTGVYVTGLIVSGTSPANESSVSFQDAMARGISNYLMHWSTTKALLIVTSQIGMLVSTTIVRNIATEANQLLPPKTGKGVIPHAQGRHAEINILTPMHHLCATQYDMWMYRWT